MRGFHPNHLSGISPWRRTITLWYFLLSLLPTESIPLRLHFIALVAFSEFRNRLSGALLLRVFETRLSNGKARSLTVEKLLLLVQLLEGFLDGLVQLTVEINHRGGANGVMMPLYPWHVGGVRQCHHLRSILFEEVRSEVVLFFYFLEPVALWQEGTRIGAIFNQIPYTPILNGLAILIQ